MYKDKKLEALKKYLKKFWDNNKDYKIEREPIESYTKINEYGQIVQRHEVVITCLVKEKNTGMIKYCELSPLRNSIRVEDEEIANIDKKEIERLMQEI